MEDSELCYLSAVQALELFRSRQLSPNELLHALIRRVEEVEPKINAFTERYFEEALEALPHNKFRSGYPSDFPGQEKAQYWYTFRGVKTCPECRKPPQDPTAEP